MAGRGPRATSSVVTPYAAPPAESDSDADEVAQQKPLQSDRHRGRGRWINDEEWRITIQEASDESQLRSRSDVSIFRVPDFLKESRGGAYVPQTVSLGPYHHTNQHELSPMSRHKERALSRMATRSNVEEFSSRAKEEILQVDDEIRKTYETKIDFDANILALMLSLDGCFILEILRTLGGEKFPVAEAGNYYEPIFERNKIDYTGFHILNDILMLENQIPLIVLRKLLELELKPSDDVGTKLFKVLVKSPRSKFYPFKYDMKGWSLQFPPQQQPQSQQQQQQPQPQQQQQQPQPQPQQLPFIVSPQVHHLLGLLHKLIVSPPSPSDGDRTDQNKPGDPNRAANAVRRIPRAVELKNAGIKFKRCLGGIKKIKFEKKRATIHLPPIQITDYTEVLFRNLVALELCKPSEVEPNYVTCYLSLMDELMDSEEDVGVLIKSEIVTNYLGSEAEVAQLFNGLCNGVTVSRKDAFRELKGQVYEHYKSEFQVWSAELIKEYFSSPWRSLALAGAILALFLTALQTIYSVIGVYK